MAKIGEIGVDTPSGVVKVPVFDTGDSGGSVFEMVKVQTPSGTGFIPVVENSGDATYPYLKVQTLNHGVVHMHDSATVTTAPALPTTNLEHRYDATQISGSDGDPIGTWTDQEGTDDLSQGTGSKQPLLRTNEIGGNQALEFDGSDDLIEGAFSSGISSDWDIYMVARYRGSSPPSDEYFIADNDSLDWRFYVQSSGPNWEMRFSGTTVGSGSADNTAHLFTCRMGTNGVLRVDGTQDSTGDMGSATMSGIEVGARENDQFGPIDVGEIVIYSSQLSDSDRDDAEAHLADKWGITI